MTLAIQTSLCSLVDAFAAESVTGEQNQSSGLLIAALAGAVCLLWCALLTWQWWVNPTRFRALAVDHTRLSRAVHGLCRKAAGAPQTWQPDPTIEWDPREVDRWRKSSRPR